jgi:hypothetical protein
MAATVGGINSPELQISGLHIAESRTAASPNPEI